MRLFCFPAEWSPSVTPSTGRKCLYFNTAMSALGVIVFHFFLKLTSWVENGAVFSVISQLLVSRHMPECLQLLAVSSVPLSLATQP